MIQVSKEALRYLDLEKKKKEDDKEIARLEKLRILREIVQVFLRKGESVIKSSDWKKVILFVLPAAGQSDKASGYTKMNDIKKRLNALDKPWFQYIPVADESVTVAAQSGDIVAQTL